MSKTAFRQIFKRDVLDALFPKERADVFFEALFGDASEGSYNIGLEFKKKTADAIHFEFQLTPRPGKCLACNLTYGLPGLFSRHPVININGLVKHICERLGDKKVCSGWQLGETMEISPSLHIIPFIISLDGPGA